MSATRSAAGLPEAEGPLAGEVRSHTMPDGMQLPSPAAIGR
jgi:hypothetical protein